ncbi:monosaccharide ABC transporter ATP-binding protein (CUT2 family) [Breoghania corrubedonensis]|uniref:Monosaccharide ABC transporter ATP-binding protein (CUT2 family) n=1 Tax=Breoghania corrubedonensis TaxID=665038 RepID=A0A2T5VGH7_9HYPH|nr:sugar ABC transporter ATP-binding protein [Breoghania corrubedonensis]PTW62864.1 monosaccharide ABC transporter ATP-binding protein (CUT2 family) [Breoghania corrubedonensis]
MNTNAETGSGVDPRARDPEIPQPADMPPLVETVGLTRDYPGIRALDNVSLDLRAGEVHILFGENGAGKSTLISMLAGANQPTSGEIRFNGRHVALNSVHEARALGISAVFQEFSLIPQMTVAENLFLGAEHTRLGLLRAKEQRAKAQEILSGLDFHIDPDRTVDHLTRAEQQMVEIAKAFRSDLAVLILDEPTASLTNHETDQLFKVIETLKQRRVAILYITHRMAEIREIGDRITVLRDGRHIDTVDAGTTSEDDLVRLMTGRVVGQIFPEITFTPGETVLQVDDLRTGDGGVDGVSLTARRGEIVGIAGLVGSGKSRFGQACFGATDLASGTIAFKGEQVAGASTRAMLDKGMLYLPADRHTDGLMLMRSARENITLAALDAAPIRRSLFLDRKAENTLADGLAERLNLSPRRLERLAEHFSGGNQQKLMLARSLTRDFDLIIFDEPTVGVDVGTRAAIYRFIAELCANGAAIILISSDLPEILHLTNRAYVFYRGRIQAELEGEAITEANVLSHFFEKEAA